MCTASWFLTDSGYQLFFNRDELRSRAKARLPACFMDDGSKYLMPVDPQGGGSWIVTNEYGVTVCLLNYYQGYFALFSGTSRGGLVKMLASSRSLDEAKEKLAQHDVSSYSPFSLFLFGHALDTEKPLVEGVRWTGREMEALDSTYPMVTSSIAYNEVYPLRREAYENIVRGDASIDKNIRFHKSHSPSKSYRSVCMHRPEAKTMSFTHVEVDKNGVTMNYIDGSPCEVEESHRLFLARTGAE
ncbi:hypothetical protein CS022_18590 [Veronia nyctiphanis]|uniref:Uncharacterized protein n=1 Tax=Veronia nyctiphanis TaxID=1278244 RepID=A0A4Q0YNK1_9GAMM|nr:NRDE family protein [Veronia nyctiphanis]RXJ72005.1 hypothetical protein CS022_18590 [Veronia nyctiphanis]